MAFLTFLAFRLCGMSRTKHLAPRSHLMAHASVAPHVLIRAGCDYGPMTTLGMAFLLTGIHIRCRTDTKPPALKLRRQLEEKQQQHGMTPGMTTPTQAPRQSKNPNSTAPVRCSHHSATQASFLKARLQQGQSKERSFTIQTCTVISKKCSAEARS